MTNEGLVTAAAAATELVDEDPRDVEQPTAVDEVVVLDYGGQYSQLIARRVRECGVYSELLPHHVGAEEVRKRQPKGLILSGGPASVYADGAPRLDPELLARTRRALLARCSSTGAGLIGPLFAPPGGGTVAGDESTGWRLVVPS